MRVRERNNAWPSFVDLFSNLVIILIFLLIVFVFLWTATNVFNRKAAVSVDKIAELRMQTAEQTERIQELEENEQQARVLLLAARDELLALDERRTVLETEQARMTQDQMEVVAAYEMKLLGMQTDREGLERIIRGFRNEEMQMREQIERAAGMQVELERLNTALAAAEAGRREKEVEFAALSDRLNMALSDKIAELNLYQHQFFGEVRAALADFGGVDVSSDRFVISSDILFPLGEFRLSSAGRNQLRIIAGIIKGLDEKIPPHINWVIRVDGHTDRIPVIPGTQGFGNNLELSLLRARAVVRELERHGVQGRRLVPAGFGETHPLVEGRTPQELQKNRRIELRLTNQ